jgi:hypothetical protein
MTVAGGTPMAPAEWHIAVADLDRYVAGTASQAVEASVDAHVLRCEQCRAAVNERVRAVDPRRDAARWDAIADTIDRPTPTRFERALRRLGVRSELARLLVATPPLLRAWVSGVALSLGYALVASWSGAGRAAMLAFAIAAPIVPVAGAALVYAPQAEPPGSIATATPGRNVRLLMVRTLLILITAMPIAFAVGIALDGPAWIAVTWLLPALALITLSLAAATWFDPVRSAVTIAAGWATIVLLTALDAHRVPLDAFTRELAPSRAVTQISCALLIALAAPVVFVRREAFAYRRTA